MSLSFIVELKIIFFLSFNGLFFKLSQVFLPIITVLLFPTVVVFLKYFNSLGICHGSLFLYPIPRFLQNATIIFIIFLIK